MNWIEFDSEDWFDLDKFFHIWIQEDCNGEFYLMGDLTPEGEDIVLSKSFKTRQECQNYTRAILGLYLTN